MTALQILAASPPLFLVASALLGLLMGSFLNVVALRLPPLLEYRWRRECRAYLELDALEEEKDPAPPGWVWSASRCPHCGHRLKPWENIPLVSFLLLRGRCSACQGSISWRYPVVEMATALLTALTAWRFGFSLETVAAWTLLWPLIILTLIDLDHQLLPDVLTLSLLWGGLLWSLDAPFATSEEAIVGAVAGYLLLWSVMHLFKLATGKEGMGYGDFKLLAALGGWLGWQALLSIVLLSSAFGALVGIALILLRGRDRQLPIPFGPFLAGAGWVTMLWGETLTNYFLFFAAG